MIIKFKISLRSSKAKKIKMFIKCAAQFVQGYERKTVLQRFVAFKIV